MGVEIDPHILDLCSGKVLKLIEFVLDPLQLLDNDLTRLILVLKLDLRVNLKILDLVYQILLLFAHVTFHLCFQRGQVFFEICNLFL